MAPNFALFPSAARQALPSNSLILHTQQCVSLAMLTAATAAVAYAGSSLTIVFANKFVIQVVRDPFALRLFQVLVTLAFSSFVAYF
jgi:hypothetical protein